VQEFTDPVNGYTRYIDVDSFIDFFIVNEVSKNVDGYRISTYLHKQRDSDGGKLFMGPCGILILALAMPIIVHRVTLKAGSQVLILFVHKMAG
jgi:hypothetical protein